MRVDLFIGDQLIDVYEDETIKLIDTVQDAQDPGKIFTSFTRQFTVPASNQNNEVFSHFYNFEIFNGFDARKKVRSLIKINGVDFKKGFIQLNGVTLAANKPKDYKIVFTGETTELKDILRDDKLSDLNSLDVYNHDYTPNIVRNGFEQFYDVAPNRNITASSTGAFCFPFISHTARYLWDSGIEEVQEDGTLVAGIDTSQLKPAIRLLTIIEAIETQYDIQFNKTFFNTNAFFGLFMWLHRDKGRISSAEQFSVTLTTDSSLSYVSGDLTLPSDGIFRIIKDPFFDRSYVLRYEMIFVGNGSVDWELRDDIGGGVLANALSVDVDNSSISFTVFLEGGSQGTRDIKPTLRITTPDDTMTSINVEVEIEQRDQDFTTETGAGDQTLIGQYVRSGGAQPWFSEVVIRDQIPQMKVIDFLTSVFKMFNLTAVVDENRVIDLKPLDEFLDSGQEIDITKFVDIEESSVKRVEPFSRINFDYEEPKTFLSVQRNKKIDKIFGALTEDLSDQVEDGKAFTGGDYEIKIGFEHMLFERIRRASSGGLTTIQYGRFVDDKQDPTFGNPLVFYGVRENGASTKPQLQGFSESDFYIRPSNVNFDFSQTINFGAEIDEYELNVNQNSLFQNYYRNYVVRVFNSQSRLLEVEALLPIDIILSYQLNDSFIINNRRYIINKVETTLNNRRSKIELINRADLLQDPRNYSVPPRPVVVLPTEQ